MQNNIPLQKIKDFLGTSIKFIHGNPKGLVINKLSDPHNADEFTLDWISSQRKDKQRIAEQSKAKALIVNNEVIYSESIKNQGKVLIIVDNPKLCIMKIAEEFFVNKSKFGVHTSAIIDPTSKIGENVYIGPNTVIGKSTIGDNTHIEGNCFIYDNIRIGVNCIIQAGAVIGTDGLGCSREVDGSLIKFPHLGGVIIGDNVEIGANCQIAKGTLGNTIISDGCKINGMCFIAHNCILQKNVWITGSTMLSGSVSVGKNSTIFSNVVVREQIKIGESVTIGMGSVVTKHIPTGETWIGNPAKPIKK
ncbi:MAG TPA: UDP-3-O-(3-hydroxymyristoyl) glucosamine N-acyltransferase [Bacteroidales bacterium]|jgi:UDP-3-O-[3-hydroxymyristoyl] glucosamine N-acyltransferase|nr:UDP-3-O-(3-hydroxymyristoyl) glucosamine N-acyltransferase [Bacteroidales bacterium]